MSVQGPEDLLKFERLRQEKKYEVALNRAYILRAIRPSVQTRVREEGRVGIGLYSLRGVIGDNGV